MFLKESKKMPLWAVLLIDFLISAILLGFLTFYYVFLPRSVEELEYEINKEFKTFTLPVSDGDSDALSHLVLSLKKGEYKREIQKIYFDDHKQMVLMKNEYGSGDDKVTYYTADVFVTSVKEIQTHIEFSKDGKVDTRSVHGQAKECNALFAITGDTFGMSKDGIIIRNGSLYRNDIFSDNDVCVLTVDGNMEIFTRKRFSFHNYSMEDIEQSGTWQAWTFGPSLLDENGNVKKEFNIAGSHLSDLPNEHPRTAIGMVEEGHYIFTLVDGRSKGYSKGVTFPELSQIMKNEGCKVAYNLDGGRSAVMYYDGLWVNKPYKDGRPVSDIIYLPIFDDTSIEKEGF